MKILKRANKYIALTLLLIMIFTIFPTTAKAAIPKSFDRSRVRRLDDYIVTLQIEGKTFTGRFTNKALDDKLEELVDKVMKEMNISETDFDFMNDVIDLVKSYETITPKEAQAICNRILSMLGALPVGGTAVSIFQAVLNVAWGDFGTGVVVGSVESVKGGGAAFLDSVIDLRKISVNEVGRTTVRGGPSSLAKNVAYGCSVAQGIAALIEGLMSDNTAVKAKMRALGNEYYKELNNFYDRLNAEIDKYYDENPPEYKVVFDKAKSGPWPVTLFGKTFEETWTLNMTMFQEDSDTSVDIDGKYSGDYTIEIEYNMMGLPHTIREMGGFGKRWAMIEEKAFHGSQFSITETSDNPIVKRKIEGNATAYFYNPKRGRSTINPTQHNDKKNSDSTGITATFFNETTYKGTYISASMQFEFTLEEDSIMINILDYHGIGIAGSDSGEVFQSGACSEPLDGNIYLRGNRADSNWKVTLTQLPRR